MKQILFTALFIVTSFLFNFSNSFAQTEEDTTQIAFIAYWQKGETRNYEITKVKTKWKNGEVETLDSVQYMAKFEVIDSTSKFYKVKWSYENDLFQTYQLSEKSIQKLAKYKYIEVIYKTDELGVFLEIENWEEISKMTKKVFEELFQSKKESERKRARQRLEPIMMAYDTKEGIEQLLFKELHIFHLPLGGQYDITEPQVYEENLPNLLSEGVVRGNGVLTFEEINREEEFCVFTQKLKLNSEDSKKMISDVFKKMKRTEYDMEEALKSSFVDINDNSRYSYFYGYGLPFELMTSREIHMKIQDEEVRQIEKIKVKLIFD